MKFTPAPTHRGPQAFHIESSLSYPLHVVLAVGGAVAVGILLGRHVAHLIEPFRQIRHQTGGALMATTTAGKVAIELRKLADLIDAHPDVEGTKPWLNFYWNDKATFAAVVKMLPHPLAKRVDKYADERSRRIRVEYKSNALDIDASVPQHLTCELIEPAKPAVYRCDPILSLEEIDEVAR